MGLTQFEEVHPNTGAMPMDDTTPTTLETVFTAGLYGGRIDGLWASSTDTVDREVEFTVSETGCSDFILGTVTVPAGAGSPGVPLLNCFLALGFTQGELILTQQGQLESRLPVVLTAAKTLTVFAVGGNF
jgi:hypothetical protein